MSEYTHMQELLHETRRLLEEAELRHDERYAINLETMICLRAEIERLHTLNEQQKFLVHRIVEAITNKGSHPDYHDRILNKQRRLHPTLWNYLDRLVRLCDDAGAELGKERTK